MRGSPGKGKTPPPHARGSWRRGSFAGGRWLQGLANAWAAARAWPPRAMRIIRNEAPLPLASGPDRIEAPALSDTWATLSWCPKSSSRGSNSGS
eukprot:9471417-Pyramimonas_sp.AAC.1